ncbi:protein OSB2, chloroplastic-like [Trifolium pratense]|uniref:protein OSB2, chloroplastic-like n=1 Tax=Trifolium pratense TaxID=57577 RepID=UPI001E697715|nr:protein OSB2, chloroplastic-like [Trifolium pratense]
MNSLRRVCSSSSLLLRLRCSNTHYSTTTTRKSKSKFPKPTEVPFQPKLANSVNLIGTVTKPIHFDTSPDGNPFAATVITRLDQDPSSLLIPLLFQGDLAHTANFHLKLNDVVHVAGQLSTHRPKHSNPQYQFQVMVRSLNFVQDYPRIKKDSLTSKQKNGSLSENEDDEINPSKKDIHSEETAELVVKPSWKDIINKPSEWQDDHSTKESPKSAAFESKTDGELKPELKQSITNEKKYQNSYSDSLSDLLNDPKQWWDFRESKRSGLVKPKYPDFKRKDGSSSIWIDRAPQWVLSKLKELEFDAAVVKSKQGKESKGDESWNDLLQNPTKWWDNRLDKRNERAPDFKHKDTGAGLWLKGSPSWVLPKLPPLKLKQHSAEPSWKQTPV